MNRSREKITKVLREHWGAVPEGSPFTVRCMAHGCTWEGRFAGDIAEHNADILMGLLSRTIKTTEDLDALPEGAVIRDSNESFPHVYECHGQFGEPYGTYFYHTGAEVYTMSNEIVLPAIVLYEPQEQ